MKASIESQASTRRRILQHAAALFAEDGYQQTTTREIAAAAAVEQAELFHHFASKAEIMNAILKHDLGTAVEAAERQLAGEGSPSQRLFDYLVEDIAVACRSPYAMGVNAAARLLKELDFAGARARSERLSDARAAIIQQGIAAGEFVEIDPQSASRVIEWTIEGLLTEVGSRVGVNPEETAREVAGFCLRALLVDPGRLEGIAAAPVVEIDSD